MLLDVDGKRVAEAAVDGSDLAHVGRSFVLFGDDDRFHVLDDRTLEELQVLPLPKGEDSCDLVKLWSGREWLALGGYGQFHHYGEAELRPNNAGTRSPKQPETKTDAKKGGKRSRS